MDVKSGHEELLDARGLAAKIETFAEGMAALVDDPAQAAIIGIRRRGATLGKRCQEILQRRKGWNLPFGVLDITLYRDDLSQLAEHPQVGETDLQFDVNDKIVLLVDDVLYTGRTVRSALDELVDFGRPKAIRLCVLVDRGHREYPIQADYSAITLQTTQNQVVKVCLTEDDGHDQVLLVERVGAH
jgi:pyrimidine operon attenuation protein/uracil phosphoribosyltransferase